MGPSAIRVEGLQEFQKALRELDRGLSRELQRELTAAAEPIKAAASAFAVQRIPRVTQPWSEFRTGVRPGLVYLAPAQRGTRVATRKRPNFAALLATRAMEPALAGNEREVEQRVAAGLDRVMRKAGL